MATRRGFFNSWNGVVDIAKKQGAIYPELVAAQWALESGWGKDTSGKNNYFGLKGKGTDCVTQEVVNGSTITITDGFIDFDSIEQCVSYLVSRWYLDWNGFSGVNNAGSVEEAARELVNQGYATDPDYADKLIKLIKQQGKKESTSESKEEEAILFRLTATQDTFLKKQPVQATELGEKEKVWVLKGRGYAVSAYEEAPGTGHAKVTLAAGSGEWFVFVGHWMRWQSTSEAMPAQVDWSDFNALVTPNLTVGEILQWDKRRVPGERDSVRARLLVTADAFQEIREAWDGPLGVTSFYRPEPINQRVGGVPGSRHTTGEAMDIYPVGRSIEDFYQWVRRRWTGGLGDGRSRGFIHLDTRNGGHFVPGAGVHPSVEWLY